MKRREQMRKMRSNRKEKGETVEFEQHLLEKVDFKGGFLGFRVTE